MLLQNLTESSLTYLTGLMPQGYNAVTAPPNVKINGVTDISASLAEREQQIQDVWAHGFVAGANNTACLQITNNPELYNSILGIYGYMMQMKRQSMVFLRLAGIHARHISRMQSGRRDGRR